MSQIPTPLPKTFDFTLADESETNALAEKFAFALTALRETIADQGFNLRLTGNLGAGKTTFTRVLLRKLGVSCRIKSPTFELVADYDVLQTMTFHHFDFYRFEAPEEFEQAGFRDLFGARQITACEWSDKAGSYLPQADMELILKIDGMRRPARLVAYTDAGLRLLEILR